jgi:hypothetical protein
VTVTGLMIGGAANSGRRSSGSLWPDSQARRRGGDAGEVRAPPGRLVPADGPAAIRGRHSGVTGPPGNRRVPARQNSVFARPKKAPGASATSRTAERHRARRASSRPPWPDSQPRPGSRQRQAPPPDPHSYQHRPRPPNGKHPTISAPPASSAPLGEAQAAGGAC